MIFRIVNCKNRILPILNNEIKLFNLNRNLTSSSNVNKLIERRCSLLLCNNSNNSILKRHQSTKTPTTTKDAEILASTKSTGHNENDNKKKGNSKLDAPGYRKFLIIFASGIISYFGLSYYLNSKNDSKPLTGAINYSSQNLPGKIKPSKTFNAEKKNPGNLKLTLYQYATCPFCCKVRAYLDYYGYNYDIVEVNSISRRQLDWSEYKKVPILTIQTPSEKDPSVYDEEILQFNDSSLIISALETYRLDPKTSIKQIKLYFEPLKMNTNDGNLVNEFSNKYFIMVHNSNVSQSKSNLNEIKYEREWRKWADSKFVHVISPNVYRTLNESIEAFKWFDEFGDWKSNFNSIERFIIVYMGALAMYFVGSSLKKKHNLKDDVRESMYELANEWTSALSKDKNKPFCGGSAPNLGDLALYGILNSFVGCKAFEDLSANTQIRDWFDAMKDEVNNGKGQKDLAKTIKSIESSSTPSQPRKKYFYFF